MDTGFSCDRRSHGVQIVLPAGASGRLGRMFVLGRSCSLCLARTLAISCCAASLPGSISEARKNSISAPCSSPVCKSLRPLFMCSEEAVMLDPVISCLDRSGPWESTRIGLLVVAEGRIVVLARLGGLSAACTSGLRRFRMQARPIQCRTRPAERKTRAGRSNLEMRPVRLRGDSSNSSRLVGPVFRSRPPRAALAAHGRNILLITNTHPTSPHSNKATQGPIADSPAIRRRCTRAPSGSHGTTLSRADATMKIRGCLRRWPARPAT